MRPRARPPHPGQHELAQAHESEHIRLELRPHLLHRHGLDRAGLAVAGVVDERADRAVLSLDRRDGRLHRGLVGDVERQRPAAARLQLGQRLGLPRGRVDGPACGDEPLRGRMADPARAARDEDGGGLGHGLKLLDDGQPAASRPAVGGRCGVPRPGEAEHAHAHRRARAVRGRAAGLEEFLAHISSRLHLVPRYRQKLAVPPLETGRPLWVDDPTFNLAYHVRHTALPEPGDESALLAMAARVFSQRLDRSKPLWELWLVERQSGDGWALLSKTHHALVDGVSGVDLASVLFDLTPEGPESADGEEPWVPQPEPSGAELAARGHQRRGAGGGGGRRRRARRRVEARRRVRPRARGRRGHRRGRLDGAQRRARHAVQRPARPAPPAPARARGPRRVQAGQGRVRHHRQRRRARGRDRRARLLPAVARPPDRGGRAEGRPCRSRSAPTTSAARSATS